MAGSEGSSQTRWTHHPCRVSLASFGQQLIIVSLEMSIDVLEDTGQRYLRMKRTLLEQCKCLTGKISVVEIYAYISRETFISKCRIGKHLLHLLLSHPPDRNPRYRPPQDFLGV